MFLYISWLCEPSSLKREATKQVEDFEEKRGQVEKGGAEEEKEWQKRVGRNPRNVFGPEAPVATGARATEKLIRASLWPKGAGAGPPNLLQVERTRKNY